MKQFKFNSFFGLSATAMILGTLTACGPQAYVPGTVQSNQDAAGTMNIAPKVDIVLGLSQDGTMKNIFPSIQSDLYNFTQNLQDRGWDYRFVAIPLSEHSPTDASHFNLDHIVRTSKYDTNWYSLSQWIAPFPGADPTDPSLRLNPDFFTQQFITPSMIDPTDGRETGLQNYLDFLNQTNVNNTVSPNNGFLRPDAMLAMITVTTGNDRSYGYFGADPNGINPNNQNWYADDSGPQDFQQSLTAIKNPLLTKFYTLADLGNSIWNCRGSAGASFIGYTYANTTNAIGGKSIDICSTQTAAALAEVSNDLTQNHAVFRKDFLVLNSQPSNGSVHVFKTSNGAQIEIPNDPTNGWTYYNNDPSHTYTVYTVNAFQLSSNPTWYPYQGNQKTGYVIQLNGSARLIGGDTARVEYMNNGAVVAQ